MNGVRPDSLVARAEAGDVVLDEHTTVFFDEAGMADTHRLVGLIELVDRSGAKLVAVGDGKQFRRSRPGWHVRPDHHTDAGGGATAGVAHDGPG